MILMAVLPMHWQANAQDATFAKLEQHVQKFNSMAHPEKVFLRTDKNFYVAGELVWFNVYCLDAVTLAKSSFSKVAYVEIIDRSNKPVLQAKVSLKEENGSGSFYLPVSLKSDNYLIRAYTSWMKNAGPAAFFQKTITIVNTLKPDNDTNRPANALVSAQFFPEGGTLVYGLDSKVGFRVMTQDGRGVDATGVITNELGDTITKVSTLRSGMGSFSFTPKPGRVYKANFQLQDGKTFTSSLPRVEDHGYVVHVSDNNDGRLRVRIQAKASDPTKRGENVYLLTQSPQLFLRGESGYVNYESDLVFYIDNNKLSPGITRFVLYDKDQQPVGERLFFKRPQKAQGYSINPDKSIYSIRDRVQVTVNAPALQASPGNLSMSVSVFQAYPGDAANDVDMLSDYFFNSALTGPIESAGYYFSDAPDVSIATDNLMLTQGRSFKEEKISVNSQQVLKFQPEPNDHLVTAKITNQSDGKPAKNINCFLSSPGYPFGFFTSKTDENGMVQFEVKNYYGPGEIIVQAGQDTVGKYQVDLLSPFAEEFARVNLPPFSLDIAKQQLLERSIGMQAQNIYYADSIRRFDQPLLNDTLPFFGKAEFTYKLDDYKRFTTMEEVLREYVRPVNVALKDGGLIMRIYDQEYINSYKEATQGIYGDNILVLLDGVPVINYNKIFSYDPLKVKKLEVVPTKYIMRNAMFKGIVSLETYQGKFDGFDMTPGLVAIDYEGLQLPREFYSPSYSTERERNRKIPDFRSTLYWSSRIVVDNNGQARLQFHSSDLKGKFYVVLQGIDGKGNIISEVQSFSVE
jgi:hypothetical protein